ncbi:hypothetical protein Val02_42220 [Virgisporangium aliadipatigenens]|uniref:DUF11 domain-containing protein n=1 Tax=Virgisporangium aliadipatigenens TaxID=741659 RepID=A0A8J4DRQ9_9ACTN|nr:hypothetical protein Val02_42220 [Virgisporangium aliadipatigenens]
MVHRIGASAAAFTTGAALLLAAVPAQAAPAGSADLEFRVAGESVVRTATKPFWLQLSNNGPAPATNIRVTIELHDIDASEVEVVLPDDNGCVATGTKAVCRVGGLAPGENLPPFSVLTVTSVNAEGAGVVDAGSVSVSVESDTPDSNPANNKKSTVPLKVSPLAVDMQVTLADVYADLDTKAPVPPGETVELNISLINWGTAPAVGVFYAVSLPRYVTFANTVPGCVYNPMKTVAACMSPDAVDPLVTVLPLTPFKVTVSEKAPGPAALTNGIVAGGALGPDEAPVDPVELDSVGDTGKSFRVSKAGLVRKAEADPTDNFGRFSVHTGPNYSDLAITAGSASGAVGATVTVAVKVTNNGKAASPETVVKVTAPSGTQLTGAPGGCAIDQAGKTATCEGELDAGDSDEGGFAFKIQNATVGGDGVATISGSNADPEPKNNSAKVTITVTTGGGPGNPGNPGLPITGVNAMIIGGVGAAVVALGVVLFLTTRRRKVMLVTPSEDN